MESNVLYEAAQQLSPWRAGTPGRASRNWRAVVYNGRPLCFFACGFGVLVVAVLLLPASLQAQLFSPKPSLQVRIGGFYASTLVSDAVSSAAVDDSIDGIRSNEVTIRQRPGPMGTVALRIPLRSTTQLEVSASVARSTVRGDDGFESWDVMPATVGNFVLGFGYLYRRALALHAGVGLTKLFAEERALFSRGNSIEPLLEGGASTAVSIGGRPLAIDLRLQSHSFSTATLTDNGGSGGNVLRGVLQLGTTVWGGR